MNWFITILLGVVAANAMRRKNDCCQLGWCRAAVGIVAASLPNLSEIIAGFSEAAAVRFGDGLMWSLVLAPLWALAVAYGFGLAMRKPWASFYPAVIGALGVSLLFRLFTFEGMPLLWPLADWRFGLGLIFNMDLTVAALLLATLGASAIYPRMKRDIARVGLASVLVYVAVATTFFFKAYDLGGRYVEALRMEDAEIYAVPQPITPLNWRVIVVANNGKVHDTRVNLFRDEVLEVEDTSTRSWRINAQYRPVDMAVWSVYSRFGRDEDTQKIAVDSWKAILASPYKDMFKLSVAGKVKDYSNTKCISWHDLRSLGARRKHSGEYVMCVAADGYKLYRPVDGGEFELLDVISRVGG